MDVRRVRQAVGRRGERFLSRILTPEERQVCAKNVAPEEWLAGRFAAKEACLKALGTGWADGVSFRQVQILDDVIELTGNARVRADSLGVVETQVSLAVQGEMVVALVIMAG